MNPVQPTDYAAVAGFKSEPQAASAATTSKTAGLLMDLKMPVRVLFGTKHMRLSELLKLGSGSVVELDRAPDDIVELVVNDRVIARGQVVQVDGCYGIRITEILQNDAQAGSAGDLMSLFRGVR